MQRLALAFSLLALVAASTVGCRPRPFSFASAQPPRLSVIHRPLNPAPSREIVIEARAEAAPGRRVARIEIFFSRETDPADPRDTGVFRHTCRDTDTCALRVPGGGHPGHAFYSASMFDDRGRRTSSRSGFAFRIGRPSAASGGAEEVFPLRVPFNLLVGDAIFEVVLVRDRESYSTSDLTALADAEALIYDGVLADPAYRWRDHQLGFYFSTYSGITRDYHSGLRARCGQQPWLGDPLRALAEASSAFADVVGVLHRRDGSRDCAGLDEAGGGQRRFSADGRRPAVFTHELGHALFGLGDEYWESTEQRRTRSEAPPVRPEECACCDPTVRPCSPLERPCTAGLRYPPECYRVDPVCPALQSSCVHANLFAGRGECEEAALAINGFPGLAGSVTAADCRRLCGPTGPPCPCLPDGSADEVWILDRRTPASAGSTDDDLMGHLDEAPPPERLGPACRRCIETAFCIAWEERRGRTPAQARAHCEPAL